MIGRIVPITLGASTSADSTMRKPTSRRSWAAKRSPVACHGDSGSLSEARRSCRTRNDAPANRAKRSMTPLNHTHTTIGSQRSTVEAVRAAVAASDSDAVWRRAVAGAGDGLADVDTVGEALARRRDGLVRRPDDCSRDGRRGEHRHEPRARNRVARLRRAAASTTASAAAVASAISPPCQTK